MATQLTALKIIALAAGLCTAGVAAKMGTDGREYRAQHPRSPTPEKTVAVVEQLPCKGTIRVCFTTDEGQAVVNLEVVDVDSGQTVSSDAKNWADIPCQWTQFRLRIDKKDTGRVFDVKPDKRLQDITIPKSAIP